MTLGERILMLYSFRLCVCACLSIYLANEEFVLTAEKIWVTVFNLW